MAEAPSVDSTPDVPEPPNSLVEPALIRLPALLLDNLNNGVKDTSGNQFITSFENAQDILIDDGHGVAAAMWAVHRAVERGWLVVEFWGTWPQGDYILKTTSKLWEDWKSSAIAEDCYAPKRVIVPPELRDRMPATANVCEMFAILFGVDPKQAAGRATVAIIGRARSPERWEKAVDVADRLRRMLPDCRQELMSTWQVGFLDASRLMHAIQNACSLITSQDASGSALADAQRSETLAAAGLDAWAHLLELINAAPAPADCEPPERVTPNNTSPGAGGGKEGGTRFLGLRIDPERCIIRRDGDRFAGRIVDLSRSAVCWFVFRKMFEGKTSGTTNEALKDGWPGVWSLENKRSAVRELKTRLLPLSVTIPSRKLHMEDLPDSAT